MMDVNGLQKLTEPGADMNPDDINPDHTFRNDLWDKLSNLTKDAKRYSQEYESIFEPSMIDTPYVPVKSVFIVAGNRHEYDAYIQRKRIAGVDVMNYVYVAGADTLRGRRDISGYFIGTYRNRPDLDDIKLLIQQSKFR